MRSVDIAALSAGKVTMVDNRSFVVLCAVVVETGGYAGTNSSDETNFESESKWFSY